MARGLLKEQSRLRASESFYSRCLNILKEKDFLLILNPHQGDNFLFENETKIVLKSKESVEWFINDKFWDKGQESIFIPTEPGQYQIKAKTQNQEEEITIYFISK